ncbi:preprotein translocase subunit YajC [bacterium]|nr:preprotein translocase subunit YajC [bacterium]
MLLLNLAMAAAGSGSGGGAPANPMGQMLPIFLIFMVVYIFLMILPNRKKQKEHQKMLDNLKKGDKVVTTGGIVGSIAGIKEKENIVYLKVSDNTKIELLRSSIAQVVRDKEISK